MEKDIIKTAALKDPHNCCKICGQKFGFWQRLTVTNQGYIICKNCKTKYSVLMRMNSGRVGGLGGGLGGASIILGFLGGDHYLQQPLLGLIIGVIIAISITIYTYRYTWRKVELHQKE